MWSIEIDQTFSLSSVKPFDELLSYRQRCVSDTRRAGQGRIRRREISPVSGGTLEPFGAVEGCVYLRCPESGSLFLRDLPGPEDWARLLSDVSRHRHSPETFHAGIAKTRVEHVYSPKLEWIRSTLRMQHLASPHVMEVVTPPSEFTPLLDACEAIGRVTTVDEMELAMSRADDAPGRVEAATLFESLDRVDDPARLLRAVVERLVPGGLLFVTSLVSSGFDVAVLGVKNMYLYPPDRTNCFSLRGLERLLSDAGLTLLEVSTPGVLDVEIVQTHVRYDPARSLSGFERQLLSADRETLEAFQTFLQQNRMSSFARIIGRKNT